MSGLVEELQVATSFSIWSRSLSGRLDTLDLGYTDTTSVNLTTSVNIDIKALIQEVANPREKLNNVALAKRVKLLQKVGETLVELSKQRRNKRTNKDVEQEIINLENRVKMEIDFIQMELDEYKKEGSVIEQNKDVLQQNKSLIELGESLKMVAQTMGTNLEKGFQELSKAQTMWKDESQKEKEEKKKEQQEMLEPLETVYIDHVPFQVHIDVYKQTERRYKDFSGAWQDQVKMVKNLQGSNLHKMGAYLTLIQQHTKENKLDAKTILDLLGKCFGQEFLSLSVQEQSRDAEKVKEVLSKYLMKKLGKDGFKVEEYTGDLKKYYPMDTKETISDWYDRFTLFVKCVNMTGDEKRIAVLDFVNGITKRWRELHDTQVDKLRDYTTMDDVVIPFDKTELSSERHEVHVKRNKNISN